MKRWVLSVVTYAVSLVLCAAIGFYTVLVLAGPHAGIFSGWAENIVVGLGWAFTLGVPLMLARKVFVKYKYHSKAK